MLQTKSVLLLVVLLVSIAPWSMLEICADHPEGHEAYGPHHGSCKDGMMEGDQENQDNNEGETAYTALPCTSISPVTDEYRTAFKIKPPAAGQFVIAAVLLHIITWQLPEQEFYSLPEARNNSGPALGIYALRGPPLV